MRIKLAALLLTAPLLATPASAADLRERGPQGWQERGRPGGAYQGGPSYGDLWQRSGPPRFDPFRPTTRVMGGPDYVGSDYGLAKPSFYGIARRPDWGRSTYD